MEIFFYKDGYVRTCSEEYTLCTRKNFVHLTNNCLQKNGFNYGKFEEGNTISFDDFQKYLDEEFPQHGVSVEDHFVPRMKDIVIDSILSVEKRMNSSN
jgi:hypothetical protein